MRASSEAFRFALATICTGAILAIAAVIAVNLSPTSCGDFRGSGDYSTKSSSPDVIGIRAIADGDTESWGEGWIYSSSTGSLSSEDYDYVKGRVKYDIYFQSSTELQNDVGEARLYVNLCDESGTLRWKSRYILNDVSDNDVYLETDWEPFPSGDHTFHVDLDAWAVAEGYDSGSYSVADFYSGGLKLEAEEFYVLLDP